MKPEFSEDAYYALYQFGSRVYGTTHPKSDWDYVAIDTNTKSIGNIINGQINIKLTSKEHFQKLLSEHNVMALECLFLPEQFIEISPTESWNFKLNLSKLRKSFSQKSSHSWVKAKKKFISPYDRENELFRGKKSLFHAIRILSFGIQIALYNKIVYYDEVNDIFDDIISDRSNEWEHYSNKWKKYYNKLFSDFRRLAPKNL